MGHVPRRRRFRDPRHRYLSLGLGELTALLVFALVPLIGIRGFLTATGALVALWFALAPLLFILLQAGAYWLLARNWVGSGSMPIPLARIYAGMRIIDPLVLVLGLVGVLLNLPSAPSAVALVALVWVFGAAEYANYYIVRLSYPLQDWPASVMQGRTPRLIKDIRAALRADES